MKNKVCHMTSVHPRYDTRIFHKECTSLANHGYDVTLIVNDDKPDEVINSVKIISTNFKPKNRVHRIISSKTYILKKAIEVDADIYHFHDPDLLPIGKHLLKLGKKVIYDSHENVPEQILSKYWIPAILRRPISFTFKGYESNLAKHFSAIIVPTPHIAQRFSNINKNIYEICNFPLLSEFDNYSDNASSGTYCCYVGGMTSIRGIREIASASQKANVELRMIGNFSSKELENEILSSFKTVNYLGFLDRQNVSIHLQNAALGLVTFLPVPNHIAAYPTKMFEYMAAGTPVISSHFDLWKQIIEKEQCGICVDPTDIDAISKAIEYIMNNPDKAKIMGKNGRNAILNKYNWTIQEKALLELYNTL